MGTTVRIHPGAPRWRRIALLASLGLNLFLLALIGGFVWHHRSVQGGTPLMRALARAEASLPKKDAAAFDAVIKRDAPRVEPAQHQLAQARQELQQLIAADDFDRTAVQRALTNWGSAWNRFFGEFSNTLVDALSQVSPEGRRKLIEERRAARAATSRE